MDELLIEKCARAAYQVNVAYCNSIDDWSQRHWDVAKEWQCQSARDDARFVLDNPEAGDRALHDKWMADKLADGWAYGEVKDAKAMVHPCLVPFGELPLTQQIKDKLFRATVLGVAAHFS